MNTHKEPVTREQLLKVLDPYADSEEIYIDTKLKFVIDSLMEYLEPKGVDSIPYCKSCRAIIEKENHSDGCPELAPLEPKEDREMCMCGLPQSSPKPHAHSVVEPTPPSQIEEEGLSTLAKAEVKLERMKTIQRVINTLKDQIDELFEESAKLLEDLEAINKLTKE